MIPSEDAIAAHAKAHGGLWRIIPRKGRPLFARLDMASKSRTYEGGDLLATIEENDALQGAEWVPVDRKGDRV